MDGTRDFRLLWAGQAVSQLGSRTYGVAYMLWVMAVTGSPALTGLIASVTLAAFTAAQIPAGLLADRFDRRRVMMAADAASATAALALCAAAAAGVFSVALLAVAGAVLGIGWAVRGVAEVTALPHVVATDRLASAGALMEGRAHAAGIAGPPLAGLTFGLSAALPFLLDAVSYLVALVCARGVRRPLRTPATERAEAHHGVRRGLRVFWADRFLRTTALLDGAIGLAVNALGLTVITLLVQGGSGEATIGLVLGIGSAGALAGAMLAAPALRRRRPTRAVLVITPALGAAAVAALATTAAPFAVALAYAAFMLLQPSWNAVLGAEWLTRVEDAHRGRVQAAIALVGSVPLVATPALAGALLTTAGPRATCLACAGVLAAVAVAAAASRALRDEGPGLHAAMPGIA